MFIKNGATRHVFLIGRYAYKIARITPMHVLVDVARNLCKRKKTTCDCNITSVANGPRKRNIKAAVLNTWNSLRHHTGLGLRANRAEAKYWHENHSDECTPVVALWFGGLILVQRKAMPVTAERIQRSRLMYRYANDPELGRPEQFGFLGGRVKIVDFAHLQDPSLLFQPDQ